MSLSAGFFPLADIRPRCDDANDDATGDGVQEIESVGRTTPVGAEPSKPRYRDLTNVVPTWHNVLLPSLYIRRHRSVTTTEKTSWRDGQFTGL